MLILATKKKNDCDHRVYLINWIVHGNSVLCSGKGITHILCIPKIILIIQINKIVTNHIHINNLYIYTYIRMVVIFPLSYSLRYFVLSIESTFAVARHNSASYTCMKIIAQLTQFQGAPLMLNSGQINNHFRAQIHLHHMRKSSLILV